MSAPTHPAKATHDELAAARRLSRSICSRIPLIGFTYGDAPASEVFSRSRFSEGVPKPCSGGKETHLSWHDQKTGLDIACDLVEYDEFPVVEWMLTLTNTSDSDTPIIAGLKPLDGLLDPVRTEDAVLHHAIGSPYSPEDYRPLETKLEKGKTKRVATCGGRSSDCAMPYFTVEWPGESHAGVVMAIGWPGQWSAEFSRRDDGALNVSAGQELTHFVLHPGESVRTPRIVLLFWHGDVAEGIPARVRAQNLWRRWMLLHNAPRPGGEAPPTHFAACSSHQYGEMINADEASQIMFVDRYHEEKLGLDYWWMDAGWYPNETGWPNTGTWEVDEKRFPRGLRAITDHAHGMDIRSIVWFEPERVTPGTWLYEQHPDWLLGEDGKQKLLDLGNKEALSWLIEHVDGFMTKQGVDLYRQDFNTEPLPYWRATDAEDRQGIAEIGHVTGLLEFWDELQRRRPGLLIDTCASGGRRNDIDALKRAIPLLRSDWIFETTSQQCHTYGISSWIPYSGTGINALDAYGIRSTMCPAINTCWDLRREDLPYDLMRDMMDEWRVIAPLMLGDFYPLTPYHLDNDVWMAWQYDVPEDGKGFVMAFRRQESPYEAARFRLLGLDADAKYQVKTSGGDDLGERTGRDLMSEGLAVAIPSAPDSAVILYQKA